MSEPLSPLCEYCGSPEVLDDARWCDGCWDEYYQKREEGIEYEKRTPLTRIKATLDLAATKAFVWGPSSRDIEYAAHKMAILANLPVRYQYDKRQR